MFDNIGAKIKGLAKALCCLGIIGSVIAAFVMFSASGDAYNNTIEELYSGLGWAFLIGGPIASWASSLLVYGFGELIENSKTIARNNAKSSSDTGK